MHYIIGTVFEVKKQPVKFITSESAKNLKRKDSRFNYGTYTLTNIRKVEEGIQYTFKYNTDDYKNIVVSSTIEMDRLIADFRGEILPDYGDVRLQY